MRRPGCPRVGRATRRAVLGLLGAAPALVGARAQSADRPGRLGVLMSLAEDDAEARAWLGAFRQRLDELGWREGDTVASTVRWAAGQTDLMRAHAADLASASPDVVLTNGTPASRAMQAVGAGPIVFVNVADPVRTGLVTSLARPGGRITGFTNFEHATGAKWLELLAEVVPSLSQVVVLSNGRNEAHAGFVRSIEEAARGWRTAVAAVEDERDIENAIRGLAQDARTGLVVLPDLLTSLHHALIVRLAGERRLPAVYPFRVFATSGGLLAYAIDMRDMYRRAASYADRILRGADPGDLPVQQPTRLELVLNLRTAKALGLTIPPALLARADEVIE